MEIRKLNMQAKLVAIELQAIQYYSCILFVHYKEMFCYEPNYAVTPSGGAKVREKTRARSVKKCEEEGGSHHFLSRTIQ